MTACFEPKSLWVYENRTILNLYPFAGARGLTTLAAAFLIDHDLTGMPLVLALQGIWACYLCSRCRPVG